MERLQLDPNTILEEEFEYIATTATQSNEDRAKVTSFYFVTVGSLVAGILGAQFFDKADGSNLEYVYLGFSLFFGVLTILGYLTVAQLARLRTAWRESVHALNVLKEYYVKEVGGNLGNAFLWKTDTIPAAYKPGSVANYLTHEVTILSGLIFGAGIHFFQLGIGMLRGISDFGITIWLISIVSGIIMWRFQFSQYKRILNKHQLLKHEKAESA
jgi:MFS family permease